MRTKPLKDFRSIYVPTRNLRKDAKLKTSMHTSLYGGEAWVVVQRHLRLFRNQNQSNIKHHSQSTREQRHYKDQSCEREPKPSVLKY